MTIVHNGTEYVITHKAEVVSVEPSAHRQNTEYVIIREGGAFWYARVFFDSTTKYPQAWNASSNLTGAKSGVSVLIQQDIRIAERENARLREMQRPA